MGETVHTLRVVVASPSDVSSERTAVASVLEELNRSICLDRGIRLEASRWETDTYAGFHADGPQGLIDPILRVEDSDVLIGIFWKRFGTPTMDAASGTEHELRLAWEAWRRTGRPNLMIYFNQKPFSPQSREETEQWGQVLEFRKNFPKQGLWWPYRGTTEFERLLRHHLTNFIRATIPARQPETDAPFALHRDSEDSSLASAYFAVQRQILEEENRAFVGRENVQRSLARFIEGCRRGYFIISGPPGLGKTALACHIVRSHNCVHHLVSRTGGRADTRLILRSLLAQLRPVVKTPTAIPESLPELTKTFEEALASPICPGPLLIVVDGLDEVSDWGEGYLPYLPSQTLPDNTYIVVTVRPGEALDRLKAIVSALPHTVYDLEGLAPSEVEQLLARLCPSLGEREVACITNISQGVPLYVRAVADEFRAGGNVDLHSLPPSIDGYFRQATAAARGLEHPEFKEVVTLLAASRTALTLRQLSEITGRAERRLQECGLAKIRQFLREMEGAYSFYHASFHEYVTRELVYEDELSQAHSMIARWLQDRGNPEYRLGSVAYHLYEAGDDARLQQVVDTEFLATKAGRFGYAVLEDLDLLTRSLLKTDDPDSVAHCVRLFESLAETVDEDILRDATRALQKKRLPARPSWLPAEGAQALAPANLFVEAVPARDVTADFFQMTTCHGRIGFVVGDAPSSGLRSAFVARFLGNLFRQQWQRQQTPDVGKLLGRINEIIVPHPEFERISMQCVDLDCGRGLLYLANAGHPDLVLYSHRRKRCDILPVPGELLHDPQRQTRRFAVYEQYSAEIAPGDILVMISDGLTEAHRLAGDPYAYRFTKIIEKNAGRPVREIGEAILRDWRAHERNDTEVDDVTLILFRVPECVELARDRSN